MRAIYLAIALGMGSAGLMLPTRAQAQPQQQSMSPAQIEELVRRSYQYVAMFNVNNKFALDTSSPMNSGGYNKVFASTALKDHTFKSIARPNNDTLYAGATIDVTEEPIVLEIPAFASVYVSLMVTGYDHYVNVPLSTRLGDFREPTTMLFFSELRMRDTSSTKTAVSAS